MGKICNGTACINSEYSDIYDKKMSKTRVANTLKHKWYGGIFRSICANLTYQQKWQIFMHIKDDFFYYFKFEYNR